MYKSNASENISTQFTKINCEKYCNLFHNSLCSNDYCNITIDLHMICKVDYGKNPRKNSIFFMQLTRT